MPMLWQLCIEISEERGIVEFFMIELLHHMHVPAHSFGYTVLDRSPSG